MKELFEKMLQVAEFLNDSATKAFLMKSQKRIDEKEYLLPFIGQFSAGKSKLINHLLGRELLPTKRIETTAFLTYLRYGEEKKAYITYVNGTVEQISFDEISQLDQTKAQTSNPIASLHVSLKADILRGGLVFVDTPGVNTLISEHVKMTESLLMESVYVVYVLGGSPARQDIDIITRINGLGIRMFFVRNNMDLLMAQEENMIETINSEKQTLSGAIAKEANFFGVCNEDDIRDREIWQSAFKLFVEFINKEVIKNVEDVYEQVTRDRLVPIKEKMLLELNNRKEILQKSVSKTKEDIERQKQEIEKAKEKLEQIIQRNTKRIQYSEQELKANIRENVEQTKRLSINRYKKILSESKDFSKQTIEGLYAKYLKKASDDENGEASDKINVYIHHNTELLQEELAELTKGLNDVDIPLQTDFTINEISEYAEKIDAIESDFLLKKTQIQEIAQMCDSQLESIGVKRQEVEKVLGEFNSVEAQLHRQVRDLENSYNPVLVEVPSTMGNMLRKVGSVCDIAMLLIPAAGWEKAGTMLAGKAAVLAGKTGKVAQTASKALQIASEGAKVLAKTDGVKDIATLLKPLQDKKMLPSNSQLEVVSQKTGTNVFDYLSLSHWFGKLGEWIDPPHYEIDREYEQKYKEAHNQLLYQARLATEEKIKKRNELVGLQSEEEQLNQRKRIAKIQEESALKQLEIQKEKLQRERDRKYRDSVIEQSGKQFSEAIEGYTKQLLEHIDSVVTAISQRILASANLSISEKLEHMAPLLSDILEKNKTNNMSLEERVKQIDNMAKLIV